MKQTNVNGVHYQVGIPESLRDDAVRLYEEAFGEKISVAVSDKNSRLQLFTQSLWLQFAIGATVDGKLVGLAGFTTAEGSLTEGITVRRLLKMLGVMRGLWALLIFSLYDRSAVKAELLMDGIVVGREMRGHGVGTQLLRCMEQYGIENNYRTIRLDVIDTNHKARRLYENFGFETVETKYFNGLRWLLGFGASTRMNYQLIYKNGIGVTAFD